MKWLNRRAKVRARQRRRRVRRHGFVESLESRMMLASDWQNPGQGLDVNDDMFVAPIDVLVGINRLNEVGSSSLGTRDASSDDPYYDANGDGSHSPIDILVVINALNDNLLLLAARLDNDTAPQGTVNNDRLTSDATTNVAVALGGAVSLQASLDDPDDFFELALPADTQFVLDEATLTAISGASLADGPHTLRLKATSGGSVSELLEFSFTLDTAAPSASVDINSPVRVTFDTLDVQFNEPPIDSLFDTTAYQLTVTGGTNIGQTIPVVLVESVGEQAARLQFAEPLPDQDYEFQILAPVSDLAGNQTTPAVTPFTIADPPNIAALSPTSGETRVNVTRETVVRFDEPVDPSTVTADSFHSIANGQRLPGQIRVSSTERFATIFYDNPLPASTEVRVVVDGSTIIGRDGLPLDADGDNEPGGKMTADFRTLPLTRIAGTNVIGLVRNSYTGDALMGATIRVDAFPEANAVTDENGRFELVDVPAPEFFVHIDGSTATHLNVSGTLVPIDPGTTFPNVGKPFFSVPGQTVQMEMNGVPFDIFLPQMTLSDVQTLSPTETTAVGFGTAGKAQLQQMFPDVDPAMFDVMQVEFAPNSAIDEQGNAATQAVVIPVPPDRIPGPLPPNLNPQLVVSIQAIGATNFDVPAPVTFPNLDGLPPGEKTLIYSFDHDAGEFKIVGTGTVSSDGLSVVSDAGVGIRAPGWHLIFAGVFRAAHALLVDNPCFDAALGIASTAIGTLGLIGSGGTIGIVGAGLTAISVANDVVDLGTAIAGMTEASPPTTIAEQITDEMAKPGKLLDKQGSIAVRRASGSGIQEFLRSNPVPRSTDSPEVVAKRLRAYRAYEDSIRKGAQASGSGRLLRTIGKVGGAALKALGVIGTIDSLNACANRVLSGAAAAEGEGPLAAGSAIEAALSEFEQLLDEFAASTERYERALDRLIGDKLRAQLPDSDRIYIAHFEGEQVVLYDDNGELVTDTTGATVMIPVEDLIDERVLTDFDYRQDVAAELQAAGLSAAEQQALLGTAESATEATLSSQSEINVQSTPVSQTGSIWYRVTALDSGDTVLIGRTRSGLDFDFTTPANASYIIEAFDPLSGRYGLGGLQSAASGTRVNVLHRLEIGSIQMYPDDSADSDGDGISDIGEDVMGLDAQRADTDNDGINDLAEIQQGLDPFGGRDFPTGVIASLPLAGEANEVIIEGSIQNAGEQTSYIATSSHGLAIVDVSQFDNPIVLGQLDVPGNNVDVDVAAGMDLAVVAAVAGGLHIVDISDPMLPELRQTVPFAASQVEVVNGVAYAAVGGDLLAFDLVGNELLQRIRLDLSSITGLGREGSWLYTMHESHVLRVIDISGLNMIERGNVQLPDGGGQLFVGNGIVYATAADNGQGGFATADVADPDNPIVISGSDVGARLAAPRAAVVANGSGLALLVGRAANRDSLDVYDVSQPADTDAFLTSITVPNTPRDVAIGGGIAFVASGGGGLQVVNYSPFDAQGQPPTVSVDVLAEDVDLATSGIQIQEGTSVPLRAVVADDVQVRNVELLLDGTVVLNDVAFPFELATGTPLLMEGELSREIAIQVRATDTGGNSTLSDPITLTLVPDEFAPSVEGLTPGDGTLRFEGHRTVRVTFSEAMDLSTLAAEAFSLVADSSGAELLPLEIQTRLNDRQVLAVYEPLGIDTYTLTIDGSAVSDRAGNLLGADFVSTFTTVENTDPGSTFGDAADLGLLDALRQVQESIGVPDIEGNPDPVDVYRFTVDDFLQLTVTLTGRTEGIEVFLAADRNGDGVFDAGEQRRQALSANASDLYLDANLSPGEYFLWVEQFSDSSQTDYTMTLGTTPLNVTPVVLQSGLAAMDSIGEVDQLDAFKITAQAGDDLLLTVAESSNFFTALEARLYAPDGNLIRNVTFNSGGRLDQLELTQSGAYTVVVRDRGSSRTGDYSLTAIVIDSTVDVENVALTGGELGHGTLDRGDIDTFTIDAQAGDDLLLNIAEDGNTFNALEASLYGPDGNLIQTVTFGTGGRLDQLELIQSGTYTIIVRDRDDSLTGDYSLTAIVVDAAVDVDNLALTSGETAHGTLERGDIDTFTIDAQAGDDLLVNVAEDGNTFNALEASLYGPDGDLIQTVTFATGGRLDQLELTRSGTYTVIVRDRDSSLTGNYSVTAIVMDAAIEVDDFALTSGETARGTLVRGDIDTFTINAQAGDDLLVNVAEDSNFFTSLEAGLYGPDGDLIRTVTFATGGRLDQLELTQSGTYTIIVRDRDNSLTGDFTLTAIVIDANADADNVVLTSGETTRGTLDRGDIDTFTIDAQAGDDLLVNVAEDSNFFTSLEASLYGPNGDLIRTETFATGGRLDLLDVTASGTYTIVVRDRDDDDTGDYSLTAVVIDATVDADNTALANGLSVQGTLDRGDIDTFTFDAQAGDDLVLTVAENINTFTALEASLYAPDGTLLQTTIDSSEVRIELLNVLQGGTYTCVVRDRDGDDIGDYSIVITLTS